MVFIPNLRKKKNRGKRICVLGAGSWGTAIAHLLASNELEILLWDHQPERAKLINQERINGTYLPGIYLPENIRVCGDLERFHQCDLQILAIPSQYIRSFLEKYGDILAVDIPMISLSKGIENNTLKRVSEIVADFYPQKPFLCLTGPSHAEEVARKYPTALVAASLDRNLLDLTVEIFVTDTFRVYPSADLIGAELGGSMKNIIAIATGISDGLKLGDNTRAAIMTRGLEEMRRIGVAMGAKAETFMGLSGVGDLIVTCSSQHSRNRRVGVQLGEGRSLHDILRGMQMVAEGIKTTESVKMLADFLKVEAPITRVIYEILNKGLTPQKAIKKLMSRSIKSEIYN